jgi:arsenical pump membrane protein
VRGALDLILALVLLAVALGTAVVRPPWLPEAIAALTGAVVLVAVGAIGVGDARHALSDLGPTVGFRAALLVLAEGCRREGLFEAIGALMARHARGRRDGCWRWRSSWPRP